MDVDALRESPCGRLVPIGGTDPRTGEDWRHFAFVPDALSDQPAISLAALDAATQAAMAVARLDMAAAQLPNSTLLVRPAVRREAVSTSALEGTYATYDETLESDFVADQKLTSEVREVRNYIRATDRALKLLERYPICRTVLSELQSIIVQGTRDDSPESGDLRRHQVAIGSEGGSVFDARFIPPPPGLELEQGVSDWEKWVNADNKVPLVAKLALAHYQFETLHPYHNGNGRLGRLVAILQLVESGVLKLPIINISPYLDAHRKQYRDSLLRISQTGDFDEWVTFFSEAIRVQADEAVQTINELTAFRNSTIQRLKADNLRGAAIELAELLIGYPVIDVPTVKELLGRSFETANQAVARLAERGILVEMTGQRVNRIFSCPEVRRLTSVQTSARR